MVLASEPLSLDLTHYAPAGSFEPSNKILRTNEMYIGIVFILIMGPNGQAFIHNSKVNLKKAPKRAAAQEK